MKREQIFLSKNFTVIESDIPFTLKFNIKDNTANSAEDIINFKSGWYIFDNNKLLPQYVDGIYNLPKYNCWIEFDETLGTVPPHWYTCYINPKSVESLSSEVTELDPAQLAALRQDVQTNGGKVDALQTSNHSDLDAVKSSVDTFKSELLDGVPGSTEPLSFYLSENIAFSKASRYLLSENPHGFFYDWSLLVNEVPYNGFVGVFLPYQLGLLFQLVTFSGTVVAQFNKHFPAGAYDVGFGSNSGNFVCSVTGLETFIHDFGVAVASEHRLLIYSHVIEDYS